MNEACLCKVVYSKWKISYIVLITSVQRSKIPPRYQHAISNLNWLTHIMINCHYNNNKEQGKTNGKLRCELSSWSNLFLVHHLKYCCNFSAIKFYLLCSLNAIAFQTRTHFIEFDKKCSITCFKYFDFIQHDKHFYSFDTQIAIGILFMFFDFNN